MNQTINSITNPLVTQLNFNGNTMLNCNVFYMDNG